MRIARVHSQNVRILQDVQLEPAPGFNYIIGPNGSGKTSFLEALHILSNGKSFKPQQLGYLIRHHEDLLRVLAQIEGDTEGDESVAVGLERSRRTGGLQIRVGGKAVRKLSELSRNLPLQALHADSYRVINDAPQWRRKMVDWGLFHVKHDFMDNWLAYRRALMQRNILLRRGAEQQQIESWNASLAASGEQLHAQRCDYVEQLSSYLQKLVGTYLPELGLSVQLRSGWRADDSLAEALVANIARDRRYQTTCVGPHRAELVLCDQHGSLRHTSSRGQQKQLLYLLKIAQAELFYQTCGRRCVFLCDEFASDLDARARERLQVALRSINAQVFMSGTELWGDAKANDSSSRLFHVKHGVIK